METKKRMLTEFESRKLLAKYKIPMPKAFLAKKALDASKFARKLGFPVVMKISSPDISHKTDAGCVFKDVSEPEIYGTYGKIIANAKRHNSKAKIDGVLIEEQISFGHETIIGGKVDKQFGPVVMFGGLGGIYSELLKDVSFRICPIDKKEALKMIQETKGAAILNGLRGKKYDIMSIIDVLVKISKLMENEKQILELDINPLFVKEKGCAAADARIVVI